MYVKNVEFVVQRFMLVNSKNPLVASNEITGLVEPHLIYPSWFNLPLFQTLQ